MIFFYEDSKSKKKMGGRGWRVGWGGGVGGRIDEQAQTNLHLQRLRSWGHNNA